jgi:hypothetical protein
MRRFLPVAVLLLATPLPALAQGGFHARLAAPAPAARTVARETLWSCAGTDCHAPRSGHSSDMTECRAMARKLGAVASFAAGAKAFDETQIVKCNAG